MKRPPGDPMTLDNHAVSKTGVVARPSRLPQLGRLARADTIRPALIEGLNPSEPPTRSDEACQ
jgi:hypothetical protein